MKKMLLVDDNDKYAKILTEYFQKDFNIERAYSGKEGFEKIKEKEFNYYDLVITDITMENQISGIIFIKKIRENGFNGKIIIASTGFNYGIVLYLTPILLGGLKIDYLIPKEPLLKNEIKLYTCTFLPRLEEKISI